MSQFAIAGVQMQAPNGDNLDRVSRLAEQTKRRFPWVDMIVFGELCVMGTRLSHAQAASGTIENHLRALARQLDVWLLPGSYYEQADGKIYNTAPVISPDGTIVTRHRKLFPFLPYEKGVASGDQHTVFDIPGVGRFGVSICYDMWFPETTRALAYLGAEVILHPSLTNTIDRGLELTISRSNAALNQCYFLDINNAGDIGYGQSILVGPEGDVIHQAGLNEEIMPIRIDLERVRATRENGLLSLGQPLKSFRDSDVRYPQYADRNNNSQRYGGLGDLRVW